MSASCKLRCGSFGCGVFNYNLRSATAPGVRALCFPPLWGPAIIKVNHFAKSRRGYGTDLIVRPQVGPAGLVVR